MKYNDPAALTPPLKPPTHVIRDSHKISEEVGTQTVKTWFIDFPLEAAPTGSGGEVLEISCWPPQESNHNSQSPVNSQPSLKSFRRNNVITAVKTKRLYDICTMLAQRRRRWANVVQMLYKYFVLAGLVSFYQWYKMLFLRSVYSSTLLFTMKKKLCHIIVCITKYLLV